MGRPRKTTTTTTQKRKPGRPKSGSRKNTEKFLSSSKWLNAGDVSNDFDVRELVTAVNAVQNAAGIFARFEKYMSLKDLLTHEQTTKIPLQ